MNFHLVEWQEKDSPRWDIFLKSHPAATFLHQRRFLNYHRDRFIDTSLAIFDKEDGRIVGVFNSALNPKNPREIISHPGSTFGGLLLDETISPQQNMAIFDQLCSHYRNSHNCDKLIYKAVPLLFQKRPYQTDLSCLFRMHALPLKVDLSATIDLQNRRNLSERRKRSYNKAQRSSLELSTSLEKLPEFWELLTENLSLRHQVNPVHSLQEMLELIDLFPEEITLITASQGNKTVAGILFFDFGFTIHTQYIAAGKDGRKTNALDMIIETEISRASQNGKRYFNFGISTENMGHYVNESLHRFKMEFGSGTTVYQTFELDLLNPNRNQFSGNSR